MSILSFMSFSPKSPYSLAGTLAIVLIFTMFKEGYEDLARHKQDKIVNTKKYLVFDSEKTSFIETESQNIFVGDILKIRENEDFPADLVMIGNSNSKGIAFVNTMNLDGETNLKEKVLAPNLMKIYSEDDLKDLKFLLEVDLPNMSLVKWNCNIKINEKTEALSMRQLMLRGCVLKNTDWVYGVTVYTGVESKIVMNSKKPPTKISTIQKKMNFILASVFFFQIIICIIFAGLGENWLAKHDDMTYINLPSSGVVDLIVKIFTYWVNYSNLIPISLYVALEIIRLILANFVKCDLKMYHEATDRPANCRASDLIEELGQVEFIFSDKTGTLTCNEMVFRKCSINGTIYGKANRLISQDERIEHALSNKNNSEFEGLDRFFFMLAICNSVFPVKGAAETKYQASSPDELALVEAAKSVGYTLIEKVENFIYLEKQGINHKIELLAEIPFNSDRKRMSVIIKDQYNKIYLYTKGADSTMINLLKPESKKNIQEDLKSFAIEGLRTLVYAYKEIEPERYENWSKNWKGILQSNYVDKEIKLDEEGAKIEVNLTLIGTSAIEDKLQDNVSETIDKLIQSDIRIWVLTGDKEETAIEIAKSCKLIQEDMAVYKIFEENEKEIEEELDKLIESLKLNQNDSFQKLEIFKKESLKKRISIVVNGLALSQILANENIKSKFFKIGFLSSSCICCRVSPAQKMLVVKLTSTYGKWISLAIGDGANDVSMIQEANIGVGIVGKEGSQAVQAADFSFTEFKSLKRLLLVHGRLAYLRISIFVLYYFYKNFISVFTEMWFSGFNGFSGQIFFLDWLPALYNTFWTSWPCLTFFTLERDVLADDSLKYPKLYSVGQKSGYFNLKAFWVWVLFAFLSACWIFWLPILACSDGVDGDGREPGLFWVSTVSFIMLIHTVNLKLMLTTFYWPNYSLFTILLSLLFFYLMCVGLNSIPISRVFQPEFTEMFYEVLSNGKTWIVVILGPVLALIPDFIYNAVFAIYFPNSAQQAIDSERKRRVFDENDKRNYILGNINST